ncbi:MAG: methyltransferase domain-containing protein [Alphaproteobacteria bacterium]|nr:methyltransferase domain-containing protein [Alphaproteobacteria bacterium]
MGRVRYALSHTARVAWFAGHYLAARGVAGPLRGEGETPVKPSAPWPKTADILREIRALFDRDWENIKAGLYAPPDDVLSIGGARTSPRFLRDAKAVAARRRSRGHDEVLSEERMQNYPRYYLQNFHFQTGGWLTQESARLYDFQVETLFTGTADTMRRQALAPLARALKGRDQRKVRLIDIACGTGRFLKEIKRNWPLLDVTALDLSPDYLEAAGRNLAGWRAVTLKKGAAEEMPFEDGAFDIATSVYLFHELPPKVRRVAVREIARVLKPGGTFILVDSIQSGDNPRLEALIEAFPVIFHEPYYGSYAGEDLDALFAEAGLRRTETQIAYLTKVATFMKAE